MLEYPSMRLRSVWDIATRLPIIMVAAAMIARVKLAFAASGSKAVVTTRAKRAIAATLGPTEIKAAAGVGAPW